MTVAIAIDPAAPRATIDICSIAVSGAAEARSPNETGGEFRYYLEAERPSGSDIAKNLKSHEFNVSKDGDHVWQTLIFDEPGSWSIKLKDASNDSTVATQALSVAAAS